MTEKRQIISDWEYVHKSIQQMMEWKIFSHIKEKIELWLISRVEIGLKYTMTRYVEPLHSNLIISSVKYTIKLKGNLPTS